MKANELRIGNILNVGGNYWTVADIISNPFELYFAENNEYNHALNAEPITITEELLLKFGLEQWSEGNWRFKKHVGGLDEKNINYYLPYFSMNMYIGEVIVKYVHHLQNWYFALTAKELAIQQPVN